MHTTSLGTRALALLLCASLTLLSACTAATEDVAPGEGGGTGRYLEEQLPLPAGLQYIMMLEQDADGTLHLFASQQVEEGGSPWGLWLSDDAGSSWTAQQPAWLDALALQSIQMVTQAPDGGYYLYYQEREEEDEIEAEAEASLPAEAAPDGGDSAEDQESTESGVFSFDDEDYEEWLANYTPPPAHFVRVGKAGIDELEFGLPVNEWGYIGDGVVSADNGDLFYLNAYELQQLDGESGALRHSYDPQGYLTAGDFSSAHGRLALFEGDDIVFYELETGLRIGEIKLSGAGGETGENETVVMTSEYIGHQALAFDPEDPDAVYFALDSGLYRGVMDAPVVERLIDGELTSLGMPAFNITRMMVREDGRFLVYAGNDMLLRYTFDPDAPTAPSTELKIYSLEENRSVRQFAGMYQLQNPDVKVSYSIGVPEGSAVTAADALRTLSTEMLGGEGPDILVLDGLPLESYIRQGALVDLGTLYDDLSGDLLQNVAGAYREADGAVYAISARFTVPVMLLPGSAADAVGSLSDLVDWAEDRERFSLMSGTGDALLNMLYPLLSGYWFDGDGALDRDAFAESLELITRLVEAVDEDFDIDWETSGFLFDSVFYAEGTLSAALNRVGSLSDLDGPYSALRVREGRLDILPDLAGRGVFFPGTVLGVSAGSGQAELALDFLRLALGEEAQGVSVGDGMPVHRAALLGETENPYGEDGSAASYAVGFASAVDPDEDDPDYDPDSQPEISYSGSLEIFWPDEAFFDEFIAALEGLEPAAVDEVVRGIALEEAEAYFAGSATLDGAAASFAAKVDLYLSERR